MSVEHVVWVEEHKLLKITEVNSDRVLDIFVK